jgi:hypothetical protein
MKMRSYPLSWPDGWQRTPPSQQKNGRFTKKTTGSFARGLSVFEAIERVLGELGRMGVDREEIIISTNFPTRLDGLPKSNLAQPADRGVAVYWRKDASSPMNSMAIDIYTDVADNLAAVAAALEAMRAIERHGGRQIEERVFRGFAALPATTGRSWRQILQLPEDMQVYPRDRDTIESAFRILAKKAHPDVNGGSHEAMAELNRAREEALKEITT